ncbi:MAG TPA: hypothetical protein VGK48_13980 [Terriglobia bacterium]
MTEREKDSARKLLTGSRIFAANSRDGFMAQYPALASVSVDEWDSLLAVAGSGTALLMMPKRYDAEEQKQLTAEVLLSLQEWDVDAVQRLAEFINFVTSRAAGATDMADLIGEWIVRNVQLSEGEQSAPHVLGVMMINTFGPWWEQ